MNLSTRTLPVLAFAMLLLGAAISVKAHEPPRTEPITIGTSHMVTTHGEARRVNVVPPAGYAETDNTYPLVIVLDGGMQQDLYLALGIERWNQLWGRSQPAILVGIETVDRQRELLPVTQDQAERDKYPKAGEAAAFREWLANEIMPLLREEYRDDGRVFLIGESAAGHFAAETWVREPQMFDGYAAISPSLQWDAQSLSRYLAEAEPRERPPLFLSLANEGGATEEGALRFAKAAGASVCFADRRGSHVRHSNAFHRLLPEALQYLLPTDADWLGEYGMALNCNFLEES